MVRKNVTILNKLGLHARAAAKFVKCASRFEAGVQVRKDGLEVDGKSIMGVLLLAAPKGSSLELIIDGPDEQEALREIEKLITSRFGED